MPMACPYLFRGPNSVVRDRYNFNKDDEFKINGIKIKANDLRDLVKSGLAKNFDSLGGAETTITWTK